MKINFLFAWYDLWIGFFWDSKKKWLYILPVPCFGIIVKFLPKSERIQMAMPPNYTIKNAQSYVSGKEDKVPVSILYFKGDQVGTFYSDSEALKYSIEHDYNKLPFTSPQTNQQ